MAETVMDIDQENKFGDNRQGEEENRETDATLLAGLNLVLMLSFYSLSAEECSNMEEIEEMETAIDDQKARHGVSSSSFQTRRRQVNQVPAIARQPSKFHTKIRDSRHCRRF